MTVTYKVELFPTNVKQEPWKSLFDAHGIEVRNQPFDLDVAHIKYLESKNRLIWVVAREGDKILGYALFSWYRDLHYNKRCGSDLSWFVIPERRKDGIGQKLKEIGHDWLKSCGVKQTYDRIREAYHHPKLMDVIGFKPDGTIWIKDL